jgi:hypothetical protein
LTNQAEETLSGSFATVSEVIREYTVEFSARGFDYRATEWEGSAKLGRYPVFKFWNERRKMEFAILFSPAREGRNGGFVVTITKPKKHLLNVKDFLKRHGREDLAHFFSYCEPNLDIRAFAGAFFQMLVGVMRNELAPILEGRVWEDTPIDWHGYK